MYKNGVDVRVCVKGRAVREYQHNGVHFIESRSGTSYTIKIKNDNGFRVMAIVSVDGLDVISGKPAENVDSGYIVDSYSSTEIKGYRVSDNDSAAFMFSSKGKSYAATAESGNVRNAGVIGVRIVREREKIVGSKISKWSIPAAPPVWPTPPVYPTPHPYSPIWRSSDSFAGETERGMKLSSHTKSAQACYSCQTFDTDQTVTPQFDTGTAWGEQLSDKVRKVYFSKGKHLVDIVLYYSSRKSLEKMGIDLSDTPAISSDNMPKPFGKSEYCTPPKGWNCKK